MLKKIALLVGIVSLTSSLFSQEKEEKTYWYTSNDSKGYISIQKINTKKESLVSTTLKTTVHSLFNDELLSFSLSTINDSEKMVAPSKLIFDGTIDSNMKSVTFIGTRLKTDKNASYWNFEGDFKEEATTDPELKPFFPSKHNSQIRIPNRTIPSFNLWAIIPNLPLDRNGTFKFNTLDETKLYVSKDQTVNYLGKYKTSINGETVELHKFVHQGKGMLPAYYWVNENKELVQVMLDNKFTFTISTKEVAMQSVPLANN